MRTSDAAAVARIHTLSWQHAYRGIVDQGFLDSLDIQKRAENWRAGIEKNDPPIIRLVHESDGIDGFACGLANRHPDLLPMSDCELWAIYVDPLRARSGTGTKLISDFKRQLRAHGLKRMAVWVLRDNLTAQSFYRKNGGVLSPAIKEVRLSEQLLPEIAFEFDL